MPLFTVNKQKCKSDSACVDECPFGLIEIKERGGSPQPVEGAWDLCINCGHCVAVCPHGALSLKKMKPEDCIEIRDELSVSADQAEQMIKSRRSIRSYKKEPVNRETLERIIDISRYAPTGRNTQPVRWLVIYDRDEVQKLEGMVIEWMRYMIKEQKQFSTMMNFQQIVALWEADKNTPVTCGAPHVITAYASRDMIAAQEACVIACAGIDIAAPSFGLGTCWAGYFNAAAKFWPAMKKELKIPEGFEPFCSIMIGFPEYKYNRIPARKKAEITWR